MPGAVEEEMAMTSREIVQRTLEHSGPERVAATMPPPYWHDIISCGYSYGPARPDWQTVSGSRQEYVDEWGNTWARVDATSKGEVARGALQRWDDLDRLELPDLANPDNYRQVRELCLDAAETRFRVGGLPGFPFNIARKMRRLDQFLMDILLEPDRVATLLQRIEDLLAGMIVQYGQAGVDAIMFCEDWGTQLGLMIRPDVWRRVFAPGFERLCAVAHEQGAKVFMHSCGKITDIIPDLIAVGIDALQFDQPRLHGIHTLAQWHGQVTYWCPVDIQKTLQSHDEAAIVAEARELIAKLGGPDGGFIAGYYGDNASIGLDPSWQDLACRAFTEYGQYAR
jgi:uroporphyrinogen decarboxylase